MSLVTSSSDEDRDASNVAAVPTPYAEEGFKVASFDAIADELEKRLELSEEALAARGPWRGWVASFGPLDIHGSPRQVILLHAHGAGAGRETDFHQQFGKACVYQGAAWLGFDFAYLVKMRCEARRRPPPRLPGLIEEMTRWHEALAASLAARASLATCPVLLGGKSMGSRVASHVMQELEGRGMPAPSSGLRRMSPLGWYALGYPFHPTGKPDTLRTEHLAAIDAPGLICQGTRDPFGHCEEVEGYGLPCTISLHWLEDGEHDFKPRKASGKTREGLIRSAVAAILAHPALR